MDDARQPQVETRARFRERVVLAMPAPMAAVYTAVAGARYDAVAICSATMTPDLGLPGWTAEELAERSGWDFAIIPDLPQESWRLTAAGVEPDRLLRVPVTQLVTARRIGPANRIRRIGRAVLSRLFRASAALPRRLPPLRPASIGPRLVVFGTGVVGRQVLQTFEGWATPVAFCDNDARKWRSVIEGVPVIGPADLRGLAYDGIVVASAFWPDICRQLLELGIDARRIDLARTQTVLNTKPGPAGSAYRTAARHERAVRTPSVAQSTPPGGVRR